MVKTPPKKMFWGDFGGFWGCFGVVLLKVIFCFLPFLGAFFWEYFLFFWGFLSKSKFLFFIDVN